MQDFRPTSKMEAFDLRLLADTAADRDRPTCKMEKVDLIDLLAHVTEAEAHDPPKLTVITTPPEVRERWMLWVRIRASFAITLVLTLAFLALIYFG